MPNVGQIGITLGRLLLGSQSQVYGFNQQRLTQIGLHFKPGDNNVISKRANLKEKKRQPVEQTRWMGVFYPCARQDMNILTNQTKSSGLSRNLRNIS